MNELQRDQGTHSMCQFTLIPSLRPNNQSTKSLIKQTSAFRWHHTAATN